MRHPQDAESGGAGRGRPAAFTPEGRQLQVMSVLWGLGAATVARVQLELNDRFEPAIAYNTVLTYLRTLLERGWVSAEPLGRAYLFSPAIPRDRARRLELERVADLLFDGSRADLLVFLATDRLTSPAELRRALPALERRLAAASTR